MNRWPGRIKSLQWLLFKCKFLFTIWYPLSVSCLICTLCIRINDSVRISRKHCPLYQAQQALEKIHQKKKVYNVISNRISVLFSPTNSSL